MLTGALTPVRDLYRQHRTPVLAASVVALVVLALVRAPTFQQFLTFTILGLASGAVYALAAAGVVLTYTTTGVFNFAHGAIGMMCAFLYWKLSVDLGLLSPLAIAIVLLLVVPLIGMLLELLFRRFRDADVSTSVVLTVAITVLCIGLAQKGFGAEAHLLPRILGDNNTVTLFGATITYDNVLQILVAIGVAAGLRVLLFTSRTGTAMRAVVDNANLAALNGASPVTTARVSWILGAELAAIAGILFGAGQNLEAITLTFFVVNAYGAAVFGKLKSLPLTFAGAIVLGLVQQWGTAFLFPRGGLWTRIGLSLAGLFLFVALLALPQAKLSVGRLVGRQSPLVPSLRSSLVRAGIFVGVVFAAVPFLGGYGVDAARAMIFAVLLLSVVVLTGLSGQISLAQYVFLAVGAWSAAVIGATPLGFVAAALFAVPLGLVMALPALRLQGLYLALVTFGFASISRDLIIQDPHVFGAGARTVDAPSVLGYDVNSYPRLFVLSGVIFALLGVGVLAVKRGPFGRRLAAVRDSQAACVTLGLDTRRTKLTVFCLSAAIASMAGFLFGALIGSVSDIAFEKENNIVLLLFAVVGGVTTVSGALVGGILFALVPLVQAEYPQFAGIPFALVAAVAIGLGRQPNGLAGIIYGALERVGLRSRVTSPSAAAAASLGPASTQEVAGAIA